MLLVLFLFSSLFAATPTFKECGSVTVSQFLADVVQTGVTWNLYCARFGTESVQIAFPTKPTEKVGESAVSATSVANGITFSLAGDFPLSRPKNVLSFFDSEVIAATRNATLLFQLNQGTQQGDNALLFTTKRGTSVTQYYTVVTAKNTYRMEIAYDVRTFTAFQLGQLGAFRSTFVVN